MPKKLTPKQIRQEAIKALIDSLGFNLVHLKKASIDGFNREKALFMFKMQDKKTDYDVQCYVDAALSFFHYTVFSSYDDIECDFLSSIKCFGICTPNNQIDQVIVNPYFGCRSLEEALIKKDLISA